MISTIDSMPQTLTQDGERDEANTSTEEQKLDEERNNILSRQVLDDLVLFNGVVVRKTDIDDMRRAGQDMSDPNKSR